MRSPRVACLGGSQCRRAPAEAIYVDGRGQSWGLCGRRQCRESYNGTEASAPLAATPATAERAVETAADRESKENPFLVMMRKGR